MSRHAKMFILMVLLMLPGGWAAPAAARAGAPLDRLADDDREVILSAIQSLAQAQDGAALPALAALQQDRLRRTADGRAVIVDADDESRGAYASDGQPWQGDGSALARVVINNRVRRALKSAIAELGLFARDAAERLAAAREMARQPRPDAADRLRRALANEEDPAVRAALESALALAGIRDADPARRLAAVEQLGRTGDPQVLALLRPLVALDGAGLPAEPDPAVRAAARGAIAAIDRHMLLVRVLQNLFYGLSLGSVLLLAALGLSITFGLMGVINMAHGEMLMIGAYATYAVQIGFQRWLPGLAQWYPAAAAPMAFAVTCLLGMLLERGILRFLYGRPLETLLATWGISLALIQSVRLIFGAQNVEVANPFWLSGSVEPVKGLLLTCNRIGIIAFALAVLLSTWLLLNRTALGLKVRSVTQNRPMAAAMGVFTGRVDMWTFGIGSGIAGLGGAALSQIGNVGPELGQGYIVDSFMVVVLGGVGKIAGTVFGAMGLGIINKFLEPHTGAVLGKIFLLAFIILFIQKRPQGLFAQGARAV